MDSTMSVDSGEILTIPVEAGISHGIPFETGQSTDEDSHNLIGEKSTANTEQQFETAPMLGNDTVTKQQFKTAPSLGNDAATKQQFETVPMLVDDAANTEQQFETIDTATEPELSNQDAASNTTFYPSIESNIEVVTIPIDIGFSSTTDDKRQPVDLSSDMDPSSHPPPNSDYSSPTDTSFSLCYENDSASVTSTIAQDLDLENVNNDDDNDVPSKLFIECNLDTDNDVQIMERLEADMKDVGHTDAGGDMQDLDLVNGDGTVGKAAPSDDVNKEDRSMLSILCVKDELIDTHLCRTAPDKETSNGRVTRITPPPLHKKFPLSPKIALERSPMKLLTDTRTTPLPEAASVVSDSKVKQKSKARKKLSVDVPTKPLTRSLVSRKLRKSVRNNRQQVKKVKVEKNKEPSPKQQYSRMSKRNVTPSNKKSLETSKEQKEESLELSVPRKRRGKRRRVFTRKSKKSTPYVVRPTGTLGVASERQANDVKRWSPTGTLTETSSSKIPNEADEKTVVSTRKRKRASMDDEPVQLKRSRSALSESPKKQDQSSTPETEKRYNIRKRRTTSSLAHASAQPVSSEQKPNQSSQPNRTDQPKESKTSGSSRTGDAEKRRDSKEGEGSASSEGEKKKRIRVLKRQLSGGQRSDESSSPVKRWKCEFCGLGNSVKDLGYLYGPYSIKEIPAEEQQPLEEAREESKGVSKERRDVWVHAACVYWSPGVCLVGDEVMGLDEAVSTGARSHCQSCGNAGAVLCCEVRTCRLCYHYPCAAEQGCSFHADKFNITCSKHVVIETTPPPLSSSTQIE